jgi:hypothetical protein
VPVPMAALLSQYSVVKLYDSEPPLPYFLHIIWQEVIAPKAYEKLAGGSLRRKQKVEVEITVEQLTQELRDKFSFKALFQREDARQPQIPEREWVYRACDALVSQELAEWADRKGKAHLTVFFQVIEGDLLSEFVSICVGLGHPGTKQRPLFEDVQPPSGSRGQ